MSAYPSLNADGGFTNPTPAAAPLPSLYGVVASARPTAAPADRASATALRVVIAERFRTAPPVRAALRYVLSPVALRAAAAAHAPHSA
jgi:hypothetical protein